MKRVTNLYAQIYSMDNLLLADKKASKRKSKQYGVMTHNKNKERNLLALQEVLRNKQYKTSAYKTFKVYEPKERIVYKLPYYPDRILHHAIMNVMEPIWFRSLTADTYSCIKGRGIHGAVRAVKIALLDRDNTEYCLKLDIRKFYPSIDHDILKNLVRRKIKDLDLLFLLDEIIDSAEGLPIGNYLSQYLSNIYLSNFDHWLKEKKEVKYYFRYCDDLVILSGDKKFLHSLLADIREYLSINLKLTVKNNWQVFPVDVRGIDFVGYVFRHDYILIRKNIKKKFAEVIAWKRNPDAVSAYWGWAKHANTNHLIKTLLGEV